MDAQRLAGARQAAFHRARFGVGDRRDIGIGKPFVLAQNQGFPQKGRQLGDGVPDLVRAFVFQGALRWIARPGLPGLHVVEWHFRVAQPRAQLGQAQVADHHKEPPAQIQRVPPVASPPCQPQKGLLRGVLRPVAAPQHPPGETIKARIVLVEAIADVQSPVRSLSSSGGVASIPILPPPSKSSTRKSEKSSRKNEKERKGRKRREQIETRFIEPECRPDAGNRNRNFNPEIHEGPGAAKPQPIRGGGPVCPPR